ncbi:MAG: peptidylprolyl isomerase [Bacteroidales bacterium]|nr:peptidylprolyl isomerase [Bacteroidales bacterium]
MKRFISIAAIFVLALVSLSCVTSRTESSSLVRIHTPYGIMVARLYDETPLHKENFLGLVRNGEYDSLLFHRVIKNFMVQGGDPVSRHAGPYDELGTNQIGGPIEAEIVHPKYFHKRGAIAAARKGDAYNPHRMSSGSQFYIVQGEVFTDSLLSDFEARINNRTRQRIFQELQPEYADTLRYCQQNGLQENLIDLQIAIMGRVEEEMEKRGIYKFTDEQREAYTTIGGTPHLDGEYTVFGEIVEGLEIIDSIAAQPVYSPHDRPMKDIWMTMEIIE